MVTVAGPVLRIHVLLIAALLLILAGCDHPTEPPGAGDLVDPYHWQPLVNPDGTIQRYLAPHWGRVAPFALAPADMYQPGPPAAVDAAEFVSRRDRLPFDEDIKLFFAVANALFDAGVACWQCKREYDYVRPITAAAVEAGLSRLYGGIHFRQGNSAGQELGRQVGQAVWAKAQEHFGQPGHPLTARPPAPEQDLGEGPGPVDHHVASSGRQPS